jgi:poly [ADP-ribose] polymerase
VQDIVRMIFDLKMMERVMVEMEFDINKMPLGKLTKKQVMEGYSVLQVCRHMPSPLLPRFTFSLLL